MFLYPFHFSAEVLFLYGSTLVVLLLSSRQGYQDLGISVIRYIQFHSDNGKTLFLHRTLKLVQLLAGQKQLAVAARIVLSPASPPVLGDVHILDIQLVVVEIAECVHKRGLACPDGLYLCAGQHNSRLEGLDELIVKRSPPVLYLYTALCFRHILYIQKLLLKNANVVLFSKMLHKILSLHMKANQEPMAKKPFTPIPPMAELPPAEEINVRELLDKYLSGEIDLICVLGPTASGKTRYAVQLARQINKLLSCEAFGEGAGSVLPPWPQGFLPHPLRKPQSGAEIISADSRQVYRGMDIGTGKDLSEYEEIPYHLMDIVDAGTKYNIFEYQRDFEKAYKDIVDRGGIPILCGGSGLYIEAATCGYSLPEVPPDPQLREELEKKSDEELIAQLASLKPLHNNTDYDTRKRLIRALEIATYEAGHPVQRSCYLPKNTYYIGTLVNREVRNAKIDKRLDARLEEGMVEEIKGLIDGTHPALAPGHKPIPAEDLIYYGLEYKFVTQYITGELTFDQMRTQLATAIHQFAKRQMTWFRGMERKGITIHWTAV